MATPGGPGTYVSDANEANLLAGSTLDSAGTTTGTAVQVNRPGWVKFLMTTVTVGGSSPTAAVELQGSDSEDFDDDVVTYGVLTFGDVDATTYELNAYVAKAYVRTSVVLGGTNPDYTAATARLRPPHYHRTEDDTSKALV